MQLLKTINEFVVGSWDKMAVYHLSDTQKKELFNHKDIVKSEYEARAGTRWSEHSHKKAQLIFVVNGELIHIANNIEYIQNRDDLLVVPANLLHSAHTGSDIVFYSLYKK